MVAGGVDPIFIVFKLMTDTVTILLEIGVLLLPLVTTNWKLVVAEMPLVVNVVKLVPVYKVAQLLLPVVLFKV